MNFGLDELRLSPEGLRCNWGKHPITAALPSTDVPVWRINRVDEQFPILLAEDRDDDVLLIRRAFASAYIPNPLYVVKDGEEAIAYLAGERRYANREEYPLPSLLLLDLKMPRMDGFEVLTWIRQQPSLKALRVVVLTSSSDLRDVTKAYQLGANSFLVKPVDFQNLIALIKTVEGYWLEISKVPEISRPPRSPDSPPILKPPGPSSPFPGSSS